MKTTTLLETHLASLVRRGRITRGTLRRTYDWFTTSLERLGLEHDEAVARFWDAARQGRDAR